jgi:alkanesulfonate monooxygenase SsuD/methylene tetrahydromethanopterin reductase-like flavin-dependent oxidoreductase (luciferase family)
MEARSETEAEKVSPIPIFMGGNSVAAREMAAKHCDWFFMNGNTDEIFKLYIDDVRKGSHALGRQVKTAIK